MMEITLRASKTAESGSDSNEQFASGEAVQQTPSVVEWQIYAVSNPADDATLDACACGCGCGCACGGISS